MDARGKALTLTLTMVYGETLQRIIEEEGYADASSQASGVNAACQPASSNSNSWIFTSDCADLR